MLTLKLKQQFLILFILIILTLTGCGFFSNEAPASEEAQVVDTETTIEHEEAGASSAPVEVARDAAAPAPAEEPVVEREIFGEPAEAAAPALTFDKSEAVTEAESDYRAGGGEAAAGAAATAMPMATPAAPSMDDREGVVSSDELERSDETMAVAGDEGDEARPAPAPVTQQAEPLKAGEVDDNTQWDDYLLYRRNYLGPRVHDRDIRERYIIEVVDGQGRPVLGANVSFFLPGQQQEEIYSARTYATGQILFHPLAVQNASLAQVDHFMVEVEKDNLQEQFNLTRFEAQAATSFTDRWTITLDLGQQQQPDSLNLDVLFLIDATGSMADEIAKVQSTIFDVSAQIDALPENPNVRYGMVTYRDRGDSFVTRSYEFTPDVRDFSKNLNTVYADGGGDYPESLNQGLHDALHSVEWRGEDTVKLIFLIADAPPHLDYAQDYDYAVEMENAAQRGIKIFSIASSGLDDQGEYIFRQIAQYTQGRFIFLTYEGPSNGGVPGEVTTHHVDDYSVENLDDLLVRLVEEELAYQNPQLAQTQ